MPIDPQTSISAAGAAVTLVVGPAAAVWVNWVMKAKHLKLQMQLEREKAERENRDADQALADRTETAALARMRKLIDDISAERARDLVRWQNERDAMRKDIGELQKETTECREERAVQRERIKWLEEEVARLNDALGAKGEP